MQRLRHLLRSGCSDLVAVELTSELSTYYELVVLVLLSQELKLLECHHRLLFEYLGDLELPNDSLALIDVVQSHLLVQLASDHRCFVL